MTPMVEGGDVVEGLGERVLGRVAGGRRPQARAPTRCCCRAGTLIDEKLVRMLEQEGVDQVHGAFADHLRDALRRLLQLLRARSGSRPAHQHRRSGRRHRRAVDRRAGHAAHDAHVPHRWRGIASGGGELSVEDRRARARCASTTSRPCSTRRATWSRCRARARSAWSTSSAASASVTRFRTAR